MSRGIFGGGIFWHLPNRSQGWGDKGDRGCGAEGRALHSLPRLGGQGGASPASHAAPGPAHLPEGSCAGSAASYSRPASPALAPRSGGSQRSWLARERSAGDAWPGRQGRGGAGPAAGRARRLAGGSGTSRSAHAPPRRAALHAAFTCRRPSWLRVAGLRTWVRCALSLALVACASSACGLFWFPFSWHRVLPPPCPSASSPVSPKPWELPCFVNSPEEIGRQLMRRILGVAGAAVHAKKL